MRNMHHLVTIGVVVLLAGCSLAERITQVGEEPPLSPIDNPVARPGYQPVTLPMPAPEPVVSAGANSLWRSGSRAFFKDQRARQIGDVLTVQVTIADSASLSNETSRRRTNAENFGVTDLFGLENVIPPKLSQPVNPASLVNLDSGMSNQGVGEVEREETVSLNMAAIITQILPNGNMVVEGRQEVRVNFEVRQVYVAGVVRPEDITPQNTITHEKIAELRVAYGGNGQITDVQQPRYGAQILDIILPY